MRQNFEDILKLSSKSLSNKTEPKTLVKLIRMCSFIENKHDVQLLQQLVEYLRPKLFSLENEELT
jgi:hypothetical protein